MIQFRRRQRKVHEIAPDEIFLDSSNIPQFDQGRLEGRLEKPIPRSTFIGLFLVVGLIFFSLVAQASNLQLMKGETYAAQSERNRLRPEVLFAERGAIVDRNGTPLVFNEATETGFVKRVYKAPGYAHLLGYVSYPKKDKSGNYYDTEIKGLAGIEAAFNAELSGKNGLLLVEEDALGTVHSQGSVVAPQKGQTLMLSIDARAQDAFSSAVAELADRIPFKGGSAVLMDITNGEVLALVSYPEYDPNVLSAGTPSDVIASYQTNPRRVYLDRAVGGLYAPGSIVKPMIAAGAHSDGIISAEKIIYSSGRLVLPNPYDPSKPTIFPDWKALGNMNMRSAIAYSSDVYFYTIGGGFQDQRGLGIERLNYWYNAFGFDTETGIEIEGEETGFLPTPAWKEETYGEPWRIGNTYHTSIGQYAMQVTPMEAVRATAAVANGGKLIRPTLVKDAPLQGESISISQDALRIAREGMRMAVTEGTAKGLNDLSFVNVAAKTGTAQVGANEEYANNWIVGFFPYEKPRYAFVFVMEQGPAHNTIGGVYAAFHSLSRLHANAPEYFQY